MESVGQWTQRTCGRRTYEAIANGGGDVRRNFDVKIDKIKLFDLFIVEFSYFLKAPCDLRQTKQN